MEKEFGGCLVMVDVNDCGGFGGGRRWKAVMVLSELMLCKCCEVVEDDGV